jgi:integrase
MRYYLHPRVDRQGRTYFGFSFVDDTGSRRRLKKHEHPEFFSRDDAEAWARSQEGIKASRKTAHARKLAWRTQYHNFEELAALYEVWQKEHAPYSWQGNMGYLRLWIFPFFLTERHAGNVNDWYLLFREYREWLRSTEALERRGRSSPLATATQNNVIRTLNTFLECLKAYNKIDPASVQKCPAYGEHLLKHRDLTAVILPHEQEKIIKALAEDYAPAADFFAVMCHTGLRYSELAGLPITSLFKGELPEGMLRQHMKNQGRVSVGYLYLDSQPLHDDCRREADGSVLRKPLKHRKTISPKDARVIPITDRAVWNILATRYKPQLEAFARKQYGGDKASYLFFDDMEWNRATTAIKDASLTVRDAPLSYHCCRHTFTTYLVGETGNNALVRLITGHKSQRAFERYTHIYEQITMQAKQNTQIIDVI